VLLRRVEALEKHLEASQAVQARLADRLEHVAGALERMRRVETLEKQLETVLARQTQATERVDQVVGALDRLGRIETAMGQLRTELGLQLAEQTETVRQDLSAAAHQRADDNARIGREVQMLMGRVDATETLHNRLAATERQQSELSLQHNQLTVRIDDLGEERLSLTEQLHRVEQQVVSRLQGFAAELTPMQTDIEQLREEIRRQTETVREARQVADLMRSEAAELHRDQHATAEAERIFEANIVVQLDALRKEAAEEWARFLALRSREWTSHAQLTDAREAVLRDLVAEARAAGAARDAAIETALEAADRSLAGTIEDTRRLLALIVDGLRQTAAVAAGHHLPETAAEEAPADLGERRRALREALQARKPLPGAP
jgi:chromosome segregation ATPase